MLSGEQRQSSAIAWDIGKAFYSFILSLASLLLISGLTQAQTSHMGQDIHEHVVLRGKGDEELICSFVRIFPDGEIEDFKVPKDKSLVITDVEWQVKSKIVSRGKYNGLAHDFESGDAVWLELTFSKTAPPVFSSRTVRVKTKGPGVGTSEQLTTGFVVGTASLCARVRVIPTHVSIQTGGGEWVGHLGDGFVILRGYLMDVKKEKASR